METLFENHHRLLQRLQGMYERDFEPPVEWNEQLLGIKGARGVGKTTLFLQHIKNNFGTDKSCLYATLDHLYFSDNTLLSLADEFHKKGGKHLFLDEVHKYENWSQELKNIYDSYPDLKVAFTGSSALHIHKGNADLSRRAVMYNMEGFSFREFLEIETKNKFPKTSLPDILKNHKEIAAEIVSKVKPLAHFDQYLRYGYYPFYLQGKNTYPMKLMSTVNLALEVDIPYLNNVDLKYIHKLKKLLYLLAVSVPFQPNVSKLAASIETSRNTVMIYLEYLKDARLIHLLRPKGSGYKTMSKPEKLYLHNTNLMFAIAPHNTEKGTLRETFFYNQLNAKHMVESSPKGDFLIDGKYTFEIGGKNKNEKQIKSEKNSFVAADMLEYGSGNRIPLWLFGFLY